MIRQILKLNSHYVYKIDSKRGLEIDYNKMSKDSTLENLLNNIGNRLENNLTKSDKDIPLYEDYYVIDKGSNGDKNFCKLEIDCINPEVIKFRSLTYYFYLGTLNNNKGDDKEMLVYWIQRFEKSTTGDYYYSVVTKSYFMKEDNYIDLDGPRETCKKQLREKDGTIDDDYIIDTSILYMTDPIIKKGFKDFLNVVECMNGVKSSILIIDPLDETFKGIEEEYTDVEIEENITTLEKILKDIENG